MLFYSIPIFPPKKQTESDWDQRSADYKAPCAGGDVGKAVELLLLCLARRRRFWETWYKKKKLFFGWCEVKMVSLFFFSFLFLSLTVHWCFLGCMWLQRQISSQCPFFFLFSHLSLQLSSFQVCFCRLLCRCDVMGRFRLKWFRKNSFLLYWAASGSGRFLTSTVKHIDTDPFPPEEVCDDVRPSRH